jgi:hypothetical protein
VIGYIRTKLVEDLSKKDHVLLVVFDHLCNSLRFPIENPHP